MLQEVTYVKNAYSVLKKLCGYGRNRAHRLAHDLVHM